MTNKEVLYIEDFQALLSGSRSKQVRSICPFCNSRRTNKKDKCLAIEKDTLAYYCHYCNAKGYLKSKMGEVLTKEQKYFKPKNMTFRKPKPIDVNREISEPLLKWFEGRGISYNTLKEAKVTQETAYIQDAGTKVGCMAFNYFSEGELINVKYRSRDKGFALVSGAKKIPYNVDSIKQENYEDGEERYCIIVEGEMDALTYIECGFKHVISVPNGANSDLEYLDDYIDSHIEHLDVIYLSLDNDQKGIECKLEHIRRLGSDKCKIIDYPKPCKDINEVLMQYGRDAVSKCFDNAIEIRPDGVQELVDVESSLDFLFKNGLQRGSMVGIPSVDRILSFKTGMLTVVTGVPSHGKTYMLNYLLVRLNLLHGWKLAFFSPEFYPVSLHISQVIETMGGQRFNNQNYTDAVYDKMKEYLCRNAFWIDPDDTDINSVLDRAKYLIRKKGVKALVIDPFNALTDNTRKNQKQDEYISEFLQKLRWFARKYDVAIFLVMHPTKMSKLENGLYPVCDLYNCKGASEIFDKADIGLTVWRNEQEDYGELHVTKIKFRHLGEKGHATFKFNINNGRYVEIQDADELRSKGINIKTMMIDWDNSNYILEKYKLEQKQMAFHVAENDKEESTVSYMPFEEKFGDAPF